MSSKPSQVDHWHSEAPLAIALLQHVESIERSEKSRISSTLGLHNVGSFYEGACKSQIAEERSDSPRFALSRD